MVNHREPRPLRPFHRCLSDCLGLLLPPPFVEQVTGSLLQLHHLLAHLDEALRAINGDNLEHLATADRLHGDLGLELGAMAAALAPRWEPFSGAAPRLTG